MRAASRRTILLGATFLAMWFVPRESPPGEGGVQAIAGLRPRGGARSLTALALRSLHAGEACAAEMQARFNCSDPHCTDVTTDNGGYINYLYNHYCVLEHVPWLGWILLSLWLIFLIYLLSDTADAFFCPSLDVIVDV